MTQAYTKGAKRRRKKLAGVADLAPAPKREPNGRVKRDGMAKNDSKKTALEARLRQMGKPTTPKALEDARAPYLGAQIGLVMQSQLRESEIAPLWQVFTAWCGAESTYRARILGCSESPKGASIAMVPDRMQADEGHTVDLRPSEQKDQDATNSYMRWRGHLGRLPAGDAQLLHAVRRDELTLWKDSKATRRGLAALEALKRLRDIVNAA